MIPTTTIYVIYVVFRAQSIQTEVSTWAAKVECVGSEVENTRRGFWFWAVVYADRLWVYRGPFDTDPYIMQQCE